MFLSTWVVSVFVFYFCISDFTSSPDMDFTFVFLYQSFIKVVKKKKSLSNKNWQLHFFSEWPEEKNAGT